ncbi:MAG: hypothetical protein J7M26_03565 [Armatimonadetes bacterium]|nr:hypothetical protein [Armatimonadota bacterium]
MTVPCIAGWATAAILLALFAWAYTAACYLRGRMAQDYEIRSDIKHVEDRVRELKWMLEHAQETEGQPQ